MRRVRQGIVIPIIPEDFILTNKKRINEKRGSSKRGLVPAGPGSPATSKKRKRGADSPSGNGSAIEIYSNKTIS